MKSQDSNSEVTKVLKKISQKAHTLCRTAEELSALLPHFPEHCGAHNSWHSLLARFKLFASLSKDLNNEVSDELLHFVITPKETGHDPTTGEPTTVLPEMLSSKKSIEQEMLDKEIEIEAETEVVSELNANLVHSAGVENGEEDQGEKEKKAYEKICEKVDGYNEELTELLKQFMTREQRVHSMLKKAIEEYSANQRKEERINAQTLSKLAKIAL